jgi:hypothetical protein
MSGNSLVDATLGLIEKGEDTMFTRSSMGDGKMKNDAKGDTGNKKGKQPDSTGGKDKPGRVGKMNEGKKTFYQQDGIGKAKYTVSSHDGKTTHKDGSAFFDIKIFKNIKSLDAYKMQLSKAGYKEERP